MTEPPRRFADARRVAIRVPSGAIVETYVAERFVLRFLGLMGIAAEVPALLFPRCHSIHTFWMRSEIDVCILDVTGSRMRVALLAAPMRRRRTLALGRRERSRLDGTEASVLELPAGRAATLGIEVGSMLELADLPDAANR